jgi:hypothetical protein
VTVVKYYAIGQSGTNGVLVCITNYFTIESIEIVYILVDDTQNLNISGSLSQAMK